VYIVPLLGIFGYRNTLIPLLLRFGEDTCSELKDRADLNGQSVSSRRKSVSINRDYCAKTTEFILLFVYSGTWQFVRPGNVWVLETSKVRYFRFLVLG
jgi:hypothetical protein